MSVANEQQLVNRVNALGHDSRQKRIEIQTGIGAGVGAATAGLFARRAVMQGMIGGMSLFGHLQYDIVLLLLFVSMSRVSRYTFFALVSILNDSMYEFFCVLRVNSCIYVRRGRTWNACWSRISCI